MEEYIAHIKEIEPGKFDDPHTLAEHLSGVAELCRKYAESFGFDEIGELLGLLHDTGKFSKAFQNRIRQASGFDVEAHLEGKTAQHVDHSTAGAQLLCELIGAQFGKIFSYAIAGHHAGLPNGFDETDSNLSKRLKKIVEEYQDNFYSAGLNLTSPVVENLPFRQGSDGFTFIFLIRMLFSCLVDADFLDTESYMEPERSVFRQREYDFSKLYIELNNFIAEIAKGKTKNLITNQRASILESCIKASELKPGFFSLTVPTGGGKTLSSMAFALKHASLYKKSRIIYVIPYTSIIEQNAAVFRSALGDNIVLEHHSNLDPEMETPENRIASENWDAPVVVTTNIQFFESLFAAKPSKCRKLHNIANSIIVIDEVQMLSPDYLKPTIQMMQELVSGFECSIVLCTATQPALKKRDEFKIGLDNVREIISNPQQLYEKLKRVHVSVIEDKLSNEELVSKLLKKNQVLCIVNTRKQARALFELIGDIEDHYHLSTYMCAEHRSSVLCKIRDRLHSGEDCRVISTQLIEAGVDVDFPVVYRAEAGIDSIAQAAGRCNREGKISKGGHVYVFEGETSPPPGMLRQSADEGRITLRHHMEDPLGLEAVYEYFRRYFWQRHSANGLDKKGIIEMCNEDLQDMNFPFKKIAHDYCLIENNTRTIVVPWAAGNDILNEIQAQPFFSQKRLLRRLQRYTVQVHKRIFAELESAGAIRDILQDGSLWVLENRDLYTRKTGLHTENAYYFEPESLIG